MDEHDRLVVDCCSKCNHYLIACPHGSRLVLRSPSTTPGGIVLDVPFEGEDIPIPADPPGCCRCSPSRGGAGSHWSGNRCPVKNWQGRCAPSAARASWRLRPDLRGCHPPPAVVGMRRGCFKHGVLFCTASLSFCPARTNNLIESILGTWSTETEVRRVPGRATCSPEHYR